jgi:hypothetical protein
MGLSAAHIQGETELQLVHYGRVRYEPDRRVVRELRQELRQPWLLLLLLLPQLRLELRLELRQPAEQIARGLLVVVNVVDVAVGLEVQPASCFDG